MTLGWRRRWIALRYVNFRLWFAAGLVSNLGTWMQRTAQDWLVLTELTHRDARAVGIVMALQFGPQFVLLPWTGYAADRFEGRRLLMVTQAVMGTLSLLLGGLALAGVAQLWHVYLLALLSGVAAAFDAPVRQVFIAELVGDDHLGNAIALNSTSFNAARLVGPALAGLSIGAVGSGLSFVANGLSFFVAVAVLLRLRPSEMQVRARALAAPGRLLEGFSYIAARRDLRTICLMLFVVGTFGLNFPIYVSTMAVGVFGLGPTGFGLLTSALAGGTLAGAVLATGGERPRFETITGAAGLFCLGGILAAVAPTAWVFAAALALMGIASLGFTNVTNTLMQLSSEPAMRGRVMAIRLAIALGGTPIGAPLAGWTAHAFNPRWSLALAALAGLAAMAIGLRYQRADGLPVGKGTPP
ncbi:MFS transporter [Sphingomonas sp.]|uniref:MFS transporter n=1 Tax=Sphingomonas sp. TaxID=28214 RepID=UPI000DB5D7BC|nr:MFS transporter [Sphingomonas sp.]PZU06488.1 MAG: MFS transporter [Sphingomonas sp.]